MGNTCGRKGERVRMLRRGGQRAPRGQDSTLHETDITVHLRERESSWARANNGRRRRRRRRRRRGSGHGRKRDGVHRSGHLQNYRFTGWWMKGTKVNTRTERGPKRRCFFDAHHSVMWAYIYRSGGIGKRGCGMEHMLRSCAGGPPLLPT